jgi:autotransporter-associated beta strand protein
MNPHPHFDPMTGRLGFRLLGVVIAFTGAVLASPLSGQMFWDRNGSTAGAGTTPTGTWNTTTANWNTNSGGTTANETFTSGSVATFSAGTDATGTYTVTVSGTQNTSRINIQEGTPTFSGGTINFNDASPDFNVLAGRTATVNSDISGTNGLTKLGAGTLVFGTSDKSFSGTTTISAGTLDLAFNQNFSTVSLAGGTLKLSSATTTITTLNITANSIIDFSAAATLNVTNFTVNAGVTLTIQNWTNASDFFYATNWTGATYDTMGSAPMNLITFTGFTANQTGWDSWDNQIRPNVPEPATYGALLIGAMTAFFAWRRRRA